MFKKIYPDFYRKFNSGFSLKDITRLVNDFFHKNKINSKDLVFWQKDFALLNDLHKQIAEKYGSELANVVVLFFLNNNISLKKLEQSLVQLKQLTDYLNKKVGQPKSSDPAELYNHAQKIFKAVNDFRPRKWGSLPGGNSEMTTALKALFNGEEVGDCKTLGVLWQYFFAVSGLKTNLLNLVFFKDKTWENEHIKLELIFNESDSIVFEPNNLAFSLGRLHRHQEGKSRLAQVTQYYEYKIEKVNNFKTLLSYFILDKHSDTEEGLLKLYDLNKDLFIIQQKLMNFYLGNTLHDEAYFYAEKIWQDQLKWLQREIDIINGNKLLGATDKKIKITEKQILFADFLLQANVTGTLVNRYNSILRFYAFDVEYLDFSKEDFSELIKIINEIIEFIKKAYFGQIRDLPEIITAFGPEFKAKYLGEIDISLLPESIRIKEIKNTDITLFKELSEIILKKLPLEAYKSEFKKYIQQIN